MIIYDYDNSDNTIIIYDYDNTDITIIIYDYDNIDITIIIYDYDTTDITIQRRLRLNQDSYSTNPAPSSLHTKSNCMYIV